MNDADQIQFINDILTSNGMTELDCYHDAYEFFDWWRSTKRDSTPPDIAVLAWFAAISYLEN